MAWAKIIKKEAERFIRKDRMLIKRNTIIL